LQNLSAWKGVGVKQVVKMGGSGVLKYYSRSLTRALKAVYPEHNWDTLGSLSIVRQLKASRRTSKTQTFLYKLIQKLFSKYQVRQNSVLTDVSYPSARRRKLEYDVSQYDPKCAYS
jgi:hypothetical protein